MDLKPQIKKNTKIEVFSYVSKWGSGSQKVVEVEGDRLPSEEVNTDSYLLELFR